MRRIVILCILSILAGCAFKVGDWDCRTTVKRTKCKTNF